MLQPTLALLNGFLFLLPGLISLKIGELMTCQKEEEIFDRLVSALLLTLLALAVYTPVSLLVDVDFPIMSLTESTPTATIRLLRPNLQATGVTIGISIILGPAYELYLKKVAEPDVRTTVFEQVQEEHRLWLRVQLKDGTQIIGWPLWYTTEEVFITDAEILINREH